MSVSPNKIPDTTKKGEGGSNSTSAPGQSLDQGEQEMGILLSLGLCG